MQNIIEIHICNVMQILTHSSLDLHVEHFDAFPKFVEVGDWSVL